MVSFDKILHVIVVNLFFSYIHNSIVPQEHNSADSSPNSPSKKFPEITDYQ